jgi:hypothetical protein
MKNKIAWQGKVEESLSNIEVVDSENQKLLFRVGEVFFKSGKSKVGLWIWYQEENLKSKEMGPVLMDEKNWNKIKGHINKKFRIYKDPL